MSGRYWDHNCPFEVKLVNENDFSHDKIVGEWLHLPTTSEKLRELLQIINGDRDGWTIGDVDAHIFGIEDALRECTDLNELNYLASRIEDLDDDELEQFRVVIETEQHCDTVMELINLCSNLDCYEIQADISDYDDLGRWDLMERSTFLRSTIEALESYIDFEAYGRDVAEGEGGKLSDACYVCPSGVSFCDVFDGGPDNIPKEYIVYTPDLMNLTPDEKLEWSISLAIDLDNFFRHFDPDYAAKYPDVHAQEEALCDLLVDGKIASIDTMLADLGQGEHDVLPMEIADFKRLSCYDPSKDIQETMKVLVVEPRQAPYVAEIPPGEKSLGEVVGGPITATYPFDDMVAVVLNDEARDMGMELNRALYDGRGKVYDVIPGTFVITGLGESCFTSLPEDMIDKFSRRFQTIEVYAQVGNRTVMFQVPQDTPELSDQCWDSVIADKLGQKPSIRDKLAAAKQECAAKPSQERTHKRSEHEL